MRIQLAEEFDEKRTVIKVMGVGGAGCNAINRMVEAGLAGVELAAANSDAQVLRKCQAHISTQLGEDPGRGAGADLVFVPTGRGGATGTGGGPVVARLAKELGALTVGIVTRPFEFEGLRRASIAEQGIQEMRQSVDTLLVIPNQRLFDVIDPDGNHDTAFRLADDVL